MKALKFILSIGICFLVAFVGSIVTMPSIPVWYAYLNKPFFSPPSWIFAPVWTILYFLMGISLYLIWNYGLKNKKAKNAVEIFFLQLVLNLLWSFVFFAFHLPFMAFLVIIALWFSILMTINYFYKISKLAAYLLIPYILWVCFALILNFFIVILN